MPPAPKARKIQCRLCTETFSTVKELNNHHRKDYGIVKCPKCERYFSTQSSLDRHSYSHGELKFNCEVCGKSFAFQSRLDQHMTVHIGNKLSCPKKKCDRQFKNIWDLNRHMKLHSKGGWYCVETFKCRLLFIFLILVRKVCDLRIVNVVYCLFFFFSVYYYCTKNFGSYMYKQHICSVTKL